MVQYLHLYILLHYRVTSNDDGEDLEVSMKYLNLIIHQSFQRYVDRAHTLFRLVHEPHDRPMFCRSPEDPMIELAGMHWLSTEDLDQLEVRSDRTSDCVAIPAVGACGADSEPACAFPVGRPVGAASPRTTT